VGTVLAVSTIYERSQQVVLLVMHSDGGAAALCPFFAKCDGVLVIDPRNKPQEFHRIERRAAGAVCDMILKTGAKRLICGFVGEPETRKLRAAGIDVRLGSCACAVEDLATRFDDLPRA
jgi:predicted Fe-Mo cluster-binding NifX family protein